MCDDQFEILETIQEARELARAADYENAVKSYKAAYASVEDQVNACTVKSELEKWNAILDGIKQEEASIQRIINKRRSVIDDFDADPKIEQQFASMGDEDVQVPVWEKNMVDQNPPVRRVIKQQNRPVVSNNRNMPRSSEPKNPLNVKRISPDKGPVNKNQGPRSRLDKPADNKFGSRPPPNRGKGISPQGSNNKGKAVPPSKKDEKPQIDPADNPLMQQIIDMGILVREPNIQWDSIAGLQQVKRLLRQNLVILPLRPDICKGLLTPWKSVLFYGPPGTGKTFLAKAVATECKRTFFNVTSATITSRFHGESEKLVQYLFTLADQMAPATIFFDEIDSIASQRGGANEGEASRRMKAQLLTKLEGIDGASDNINVFVLAATNFPWDLDEALIRRFQKRIYIPLPDAEGRLAILKMKITEFIDDSFDLEGWAQKLEGYSCADIANLCKDAAQAVFDRQTSNLDTQEWVNMPAEQARIIITNEDFAKAVKLRRSSVDPASLKKYEEWGKARGAE